MDQADRIKLQEASWRGAHRKLVVKGMPCGPGSLPAAMKDIVRDLPYIITKWDIKSMSDVPCGMADWIKPILPAGIDYHGYDLLSEMIEHNTKDSWKDKFTQFNILTGSLPKRDLILCRDLLIHLHPVEIRIVLKTFKDSGSRYLLVSTYPYAVYPANVKIASLYSASGAGAIGWNLEAAPFNMIALDRIKETHPSCRRRELILTRLSDVPLPEV